MAETQKTYKSDDGLTLFYRKFGADNRSYTPVICLPGLTRNSRDFIPLAHRLSARRRVLCPDLRGRGFSDWDENAQNYQPLTYVNDVFKLLQEGKIDRVIVIGTSLGGVMAMAMAAMKPELLAGAVLNDVGPEVAPEGLARIRQYVGRHGPVENWADAVAQARSVYEDALPGLSDEEWLSFTQSCYREDDDGVVRPDMDPKVGDAARDPSAVPPDLWEMYSALKHIPTLAIRGATSDILSKETFDKMAAEKPDLVRVTAPNRGHAPLLNEPVVKATIADFLEELP